jgi:hypothetical protein
MKYPILALLALLFTACSGGGDPGVDAASARSCSSTFDGCECGPDVGGDLDCSPAGLGTDAQCCEFTASDGCACHEVGCRDHGFGLCMCDTQTDSGTEVASCGPPANGHCCLNEVNDACICNNTECGGSTVEVPSCTTDSFSVCGSQSTPVASCS